MSKKQLKVLIPQQTFEISEGEEITLTPFKVKDFPFLFNLIETYMIELSPFWNENKKDEKDENNDKKQDKTFFDFILFLIHSKEGKYPVLEDLMDLLCLASNWKKEKFEKLSYDELIALAVEVFDMNTDFFARIQTRKSPKDNQQEENPKTTASLSAA